MLWQDFLIQVQAAFGISDLVVTAMFLSLFISVGLLVIVAAATRSELGTVATAMCLLCMWTVIGWIPPWIMIMTVLLISGIYALLVKKVFG